MSKLETIEQAWQGYLLSVWPELKPTDHQYLEVKMCFFAGASVVVKSMEQISTDDSISEKQGIDHMERMRDEVYGFFADLNRVNNERN